MNVFSYLKYWLLKCGRECFSSAGLTLLITVFADDKFCDPSYRYGKRQWKLYIFIGYDQITLKFIHNYHWASKFASYMCYMKHINSLTNYAICTESEFNRKY